MSQESVFQTSDRTERGTGRLSFFPSCYCYSLAVTDNLLSFLVWLDLGRRKVIYLRAVLLEPSSPVLSVVRNARP